MAEVGRYHDVEVVWIQWLLCMLLLLTSNLAVEHEDVIRSAYQYVTAHTNRDNKCVDFMNNLCTETAFK